MAIQIFSASMKEKTTQFITRQYGIVIGIISKGLSSYLDCFSLNRFLFLIFERINCKTLRINDYLCENFKRIRYEYLCWKP